MKNLLYTFKIKNEEVVVLTLGGDAANGWTFKASANNKFFAAKSNTDFVYEDDENGRNGFDYAMKIPGMNKVLQAAGRVIRTERDKGVVLLLDERFTDNSYQRMFPREWKGYTVTGLSGIADGLESFWEKD